MRDVDDCPVNPDGRGLAYGFLAERIAQEVKVNIDLDVIIVRLYFAQWLCHYNRPFYVK